MADSKSAALPLGDAPIDYFVFSKRPLMNCAREIIADSEDGDIEKRFQSFLLER